MRAASSLCSAAVAAWQCCIGRSAVALQWQGQAKSSAAAAVQLQHTPHRPLCMQTADCPPTCLPLYHAGRRCIKLPSTQLFSRPPRTGIRGQQALGRKLKFATAQHNNLCLQHTFELVLLTFGTLWLPARSLTTNEFRFLFVHAFSDHNGVWCCDSSANETTGLSVP